MKKIIFMVAAVAVCLRLSSCLPKEHTTDFSTQLKIDIAKIDTYLTANNITAVKDSSGVRYVISKLGGGAKPTLAGNISVKYQASELGSSSVFDQTAGWVYPLNTLIAGWQFVLPKIPKGSLFTLYVPSGLAYGSSGNGPVAANTNVVFNVELLDDDAQLAADKVALDAYLDSIHAVNVIKDTSGLRIVVDTVGTGVNPTANSNVLVTYTGRFLSTNAIFDSQSTPTVFSLPNVIVGWQKGLPLVKTGSTFTLYVPSGLAYGPETKAVTGGSIPPNSNLMFKIHLISTN